MAHFLKMGPNIHSLPSLQFSTRIFMAFLDKQGSFHRDLALGQKAKYPLWSFDTLASLYKLPNHNRACFTCVQTDGAFSLMMVPIKKKDWSSAINEKGFLLSQEFYI